MKMKVRMKNGDEFTSDTMKQEEIDNLLKNSTGSLLFMSNEGEQTNIIMITEISSIHTGEKL